MGWAAGAALALAGCGGGADDGGADAAGTTAGSTGGEAAAAPEPAPDEGEAQAGEVGAGADDDADAAAARAEDDTGEAVATAAEPEAEADAEAAWRTKVRRGRRIYDRVCETCHPGGDEDLGPRIIGKNLTVAVMTRQIRQGVGRMKPIPPSKLPERYMDDLMAYLSTLRVVRGVPRP